MPKENLFRGDGLELSISIEEGDAVVLLTLKMEDITITRQFDREELAVFQEAVTDSFYYLSLLERALKDKQSNGLKISDNRLFKTFQAHIKKTRVRETKPELWPTYKLSDILTTGRPEAEVFIGLPEKQIDIFTIERIQNATGDFMEAMGFELETQDEPVFGSFFQRLKYLLKGEVQKEAGEIYSKGKAALEAQFIDLPSAEATDKLASASAALITSLNGVSDAAIRCGSILLVKVTKDGIPKIVIETVSPELASLLNKNPALLQNPTIVFDLISGMRAPDRTIEESGSAKLIE